MMSQFLALLVALTRIQQMFEGTGMFLVYESARILSRGQPVRSRFWLLLFCVSLYTTPIFAEELSPVGLWYNVDDRTGRPRAEIRITEHQGVLTGRIERSLSADPVKEESHCSRCTDDRKGQPLIGMAIIRDARLATDRWWEGGTILDPDNGKTYTLRLRVADDNQSLLVRGYIGPFFRTQIWYRVRQ